MPNKMRNGMPDGMSEYIQYMPERMAHRMSKYMLDRMPDKHVRICVRVNMSWWGSLETLPYLRDEHLPIHGRSATDSMDFDYVP